MYTVCMMSGCGGSYLDADKNREINVPKLKAPSFLS